MLSAVWATAVRDTVSAGVRFAAGVDCQASSRRWRLVRVCFLYLVFSLEKKSGRMEEGDLE